MPMLHVSAFADGVEVGPVHAKTEKLRWPSADVGNDFEADMAKVAADPVVRYWWTYCEVCQSPLRTPLSNTSLPGPSAHPPRLSICSACHNRLFADWTGPPPSQGGEGDPQYPGEWWSPMTQVHRGDSKVATSTLSIC